MTTLKSHLLIAATLLAAAVSCSKNEGQVNSAEDLYLGEQEILLDYNGRDDISVELLSGNEWMFDSFIPANPQQDNEQWIEPDELYGDGNTVIAFQCTENTANRTRKAYMRFKLKGLYPEYRSVTVTQTGTPKVKTIPISDASSESITLYGEYAYTGEAEFISRTGFSIIKDNDTENPATVYCESSEKSFSYVYPIEPDSDYSVTAFAEDSNDNRFIGQDTQDICIRFSFGSPGLTGGTIRSEMDIKDICISVPYYFGDGNTYRVSASSTVEGLAVEETDVTFSKDGGIMTLPISGRTTETGKVTFTVTGLPESITEPISLTAVILQGGKDIVLYRESFGPLIPYPDGTDKAYNMTVSDPVNEPIKSISFLKEGQPSAEYIRTDANINVRHEPVMFPNTDNYPWASGSPVLIAASGTTGSIIISNLNIPDANNIRIDFGYRYTANHDINLTKNEIVIEYSTDGGETWNATAWETSKPWEKGKYVTIQSNGEIHGSEKFSLKITFSSSVEVQKPGLIEGSKLTKADEIRIDDIRIIGDFI